MPFVYSTLPASCKFTSHLPKRGGKHQTEIREIEYEVFIKGGHGVAIPGTIDTLFGVMTEVSEKQLGFLLANDGFQQAIKDGFISYENKKETAPEKMAKNMEQVSKSSPLTIKDLEVEETGPASGKVYKLKRDV